MFTVYKITNFINGKHYIGVHKTDNPNDCYYGSGRAIRAAIKQYGRKNFKKDILFVFEDAASAFGKEAELTSDFHRRVTYNMRRGGVGGFTSDNAAKGGMALSAETHRAAGKRSKELGLGVHALTREQMAANGRAGGLKTKGMVKSEAHRQKLREAALRDWALRKEAKSKSGDRLLITV